ncbi:hypothetical protein GDO81_012871 [Engystomops pustulosus]|uniref:Uncharacterized protein n=4 Tax=Engystomops pustulosus TaxID=76066 RepID=A0AAV7AVA5_ENGPU|nr:hypothetical protein GDO81_012871 [Engystomops pustulosus]
MYRKQIRELGVKCDDLQIQLFRSEGKRLALETKLKRMDSPALSSDADDISSRSSQEINVQNYPDEQPSPTSDHKEPPGETRNREDPHESLQTEKDAQIVMNGAPTFKSKTSKLYNGTEHGRR